MGLERFVELCLEAAIDVGEESFLAAFGHQWEFPGEERLSRLDRFFRRLEGFGVEFVEVREVPDLAGLR